MDSLLEALAVEHKIMAVILLLQIIHTTRMRLNHKRKFMEQEHLCSSTGL